MISRRNIRVKVMQTIYTTATMEQELKPGAPQQLLDNHFHQTQSLLIYLTYFLTELARYAETDAHKKASKHLPTEADLSINIKLAGNELLWKMLEDPELKKQFAKEKPELKMDQDFLKKTYIKMVATPQYQEYIGASSRDKNLEKGILEFMLNDILLANEDFISHIEENFSNWDDDGEMVVQLLAGYLTKPGSYDFTQMPGTEKALFAKNLLRTVLEKNTLLEEMIVPKLKNWDPERIALLDMIMMKMGVAEFLFFETIPPKVTINEYIDLAKEYSTAQSGQFVNGILDNIHKELVSQGKMRKVDYRKP
ncbi:MAG: transcription antitermination factor NusB [Chitinophagaceae bacterium]|nr:transcription antitermination factor NusB [Chitinophagaceae bacterium]